MPLNEQQRAALSLVEELTDDEYFDLPSDARDDLEDRLASLPLRGLALAAPAGVDLALREALPVLLLRQTTELRDWQVSFEPNTRVLVVHLGTGRCMLGDPFQKRGGRASTRSDPSRSGAAPTGDAAASWLTALYTIDARRVTGSWAELGRYAVTVLNHDTPSNTVVVTVTRDGAELPALLGFPRGAAERLAAAGEPDAVTRRAPAAATPTLEGQGVALARGAGDDAQRVFGAVRLALSPNHLVVAGDGDAPDAVVVGALLVFRLDTRAPLGVAPLQLPVLRPNAAAGDEVEAVFDVDLARLTGQALGDAEHAVYGVFGEHVSPPLLLTPAD